MEVQKSIVVVRQLDLLKAVFGDREALIAARSVIM